MTWGVMMPLILVCPISRMMRSRMASERMMVGKVLMICLEMSASVLSLPLMMSVTVLLEEWTDSTAWHSYLGV